MRRRDFLKTAAIGSAATIAGVGLHRPAAGDLPDVPLARKLRRWRGFNLLEKFTVARQRPFLGSDFQWMADWGFDFVRLPMDYRCWTDSKDPYKFNEKILGEVDQAIEFGRKHGIHVDLNLHRAPGYCVNKPPEKLDLWTNEEAQGQFDFQWSTFAKRYRGIPSKQLSFNLVNEPGKLASDVYAPVVRRVVAAIRRADPDRLVIADGLQWGREPVAKLADLRIAQSTRGYDPMQLTHYQAPWVSGQRWSMPTWPLRADGRVFDRERLLRERIRPWQALAARGVGVHVGEWGVFNKTPHEVVLAWARDCLELWKDAGWGWALWNLRGGMGIVDSQRSDVAYEDFRGHKLDRKMLDLLRAN